MTTYATRSYAWAGFTIVLVLLASPASAQYRPRPLNDPATGELYHIEASVSWWRPTTDMVVASEGLGIPGTAINFKTDLGIQDKGFPALSFVLRPARSHKLRMQYIPIKYTGSATLRRAIVFNGLKIPDSIDDRYKAHYVDVDIYGTVNFTNNFGVQGGYRMLDLGYLIKKDTGSFTLKGLYFGGVARY